MHDDRAQALRLGLDLPLGVVELPRERLSLGNHILDIEVELAEVYREALVLRLRLATGFLATHLEARLQRA